MARRRRQVLAESRRASTFSRIGTARSASICSSALRAMALVSSSLSHSSWREGRGARAGFGARPERATGPGIAPVTGTDGAAGAAAASATSAISCADSASPRRASAAVMRVRSASPSPRVAAPG